MRDPISMVRQIAEAWAVENGENIASMNPMRFAVGIEFICRYLFDGNRSNGETFNCLFFQGNFYPWILSGSWEASWHIIGETNFYKSVKFVPSKIETRFQDLKFSGTRASSTETHSESTNAGRTTHSSIEYSIALPSSGWAHVKELSRSSPGNQHFQLSIDLIPAQIRVRKDERIGSRASKQPRETSIVEYITREIIPQGASDVSVSSQLQQDHDVDVRITWNSHGLDQVYECQVTTCESSLVLKAIAENQSLHLVISRDDVRNSIRAAILTKMKRENPEVALIVDGGFCLPPSETLWHYFDECIEELEPQFKDVWLVTRIQGMMYRAGSKSATGLFPNSHGGSNWLPTVDSNHD